MTLTFGLLGVMFVCWYLWCLWTMFFVCDRPSHFLAACYSTSEVFVVVNFVVMFAVLVHLLVYLTN
jgi:hypothetical protein